MSTSKEKGRAKAPAKSPAKPKTAAPKAAPAKAAAAEVAPLPVAAAPVAPAAAAPVVVSKAAAVVVTPTPATKAAPAAVGAAFGIELTPETMLAAFRGGNPGAVSEANAAVLQGLGEIGQELATSARQAMEEAMRTTRSLMGVRTVGDLLELNRGLAQSAVDGMLQSSTRLAEIGLRTATRAFSTFGQN